jgi:hypothetical protein
MKFRLKTPYTRQPKGGWHIVLDQIRFEAEGPEELGNKLRDYWMSNGVVPKDSNQLIVDYVAPRWPHLVQESPSPFKNDQIPSPTLAERCMNANSTFLAHPLKDKPIKSEVDAKVVSCLKCRQNSILSGALKDDLDRTAFLLTKGDMPKLGGCLHHGWDNRIAVQWPRPVLAKLEQGPVEGCWLGRTPELEKLPVPKK